MKNVLFVCTANVCRSPMAKAIFDALAADRGLDLGTESAGIIASEGRTMDGNARAVLEEAGVHPHGHRARQVNETLLEGADLVLAMTPRHVAKLRGLCTASLAKIHTLPGYARDAPDLEGISDPYGHPMSAYRASMRQIFEHVDLLVTRLKD